MRIVRLRHFIAVDGDNCKLEDNHYVNEVAKNRVLWEGFEASGYVLDEALNKFKGHSVINDKIALLCYEHVSGKFETYVRFLDEKGIRDMPITTYEELFEMLNKKGVELKPTKRGENFFDKTSKGLVNKT